MLARVKRAEAADELRKVLDVGNHCDCDHHVDDHEAREDTHETPCLIKGCGCRVWSEKGYKEKLNRIIRAHESAEANRQTALICVALFALAAIILVIVHAVR